MKKLLIILTVFFKTCTPAIAQVYLSLSTGYASDHYLQGSVNIGAEWKKEDARLVPFAEFGAKIQATLNNVPQVMNLNSGVEFHANKFFASGKIGAAYVFNLQVEDIKVSGDSIIVLSPGADKSYFWSPSFAVSVGYEIADMPLFFEASYTGKMMWYGVGVKVVIGE